MKNFSQAIKDQDAETLAALIKQFGLVLEDNKIKTKNKKKTERDMIFWNQQQQITKIKLNALYGTLLQKGSKFNDKRLGQSVTLTGRCITRHMTAKLNEVITGEYDYLGEAIVYGDTDSHFGEAIIRTTNGSIRTDDAFELGNLKYTECEKEYSSEFPFKVLTFNPETDLSQYDEIAYIYRHQTTKEKWEIIDEDGRKIEVTGDHSIMVERDGTLLEICAKDVEETDVLITVSDGGMNVERKKIQSIKKIGNFDDYVYDVGMKGTERQWYFANDVLVHNSTYFTAWNFMQKNKIEFSWKKEDVISLYDQIAEQVNLSFPETMHQMFNSGLDRGAIIQAGRELVGIRSLFVQKKRYAILVFDNDGFREDRDGKPGKLKVMGLDIKRADSSKTIQQFLEDCMMYVLSGGDEDGLRTKIQDFREIFRALPSWEKGSPKSANKVSFYHSELKKKGSGANLPGHVRASINWNSLCEIHNDRYSTRVTDGARIIVCKLKPNNPLNMTSVAYPVDQEILPQWFKDLPFDDEKMEASGVEKKLHNIFEILGWDLTIGNAAQSEVLKKMFEF